MKTNYPNLSLEPVKTESGIKLKRGSTVQGFYKFGRGKTATYYLVVQNGGTEGISIQFEVKQ